MSLTALPPSPTLKDLRLVGAMTVAQSAEDVRRALMARAARPLAVPAAARGLLSGVGSSSPGCAKSHSVAMTPVSVYRVLLSADGSGSVGQPECWQLPAFDDETAQRAVAVCLPSGAVLAPDPARTAVGSMYEPVVEALWQQTAVGHAGGETLAALLAAARPATTRGRP